VWHDFSLPHVVPLLGSIGMHGIVKNQQLSHPTIAENTPQKSSTPIVQPILSIGITIAVLAQFTAVSMLKTYEASAGV